MNTVAVLGAGMMGTALCTPIADSGHQVRLIGTHLDDAWVTRMKHDRVHPRLGVALPDTVTPFFFSELDLAMRDADLVVLGVSSAGVRWAASTLRPFLREGMPILSVTKGLEETEPGVLRVLPDVLRDELPEPWRATVFPAAIGGPCIAGELARRVPTAVVFTGRDALVLETFADAFSTDYYHVRVAEDVVGVEVGAALKNAYAMAVGIGAGMHEKRGGTAGPVAFHNLEAAIFAQACVEMDRLVRALGGDPAQVPHLAGAGDLMVTCSGGRSTRLGKHLGRGLSFREATEQMAGDTLESADTVRVVGRALPKMHARGLLPKGSMPLMEHLYEVIVCGGSQDMPLHRFFR